MWRRVDLVRTDVSEERIASKIMLERISELRRRYVSPKRPFLQQSHGVTSQKMSLLVVVSVKTSDLTTRKCFNLTSRIFRYNVSFMIQLALLRAVLQLLLIANVSTSLFLFTLRMMWSSDQSSWLLTKRSRIRFPELPDFLSSNGSGRGPHSLVRINEELLERKVAAPV
jgi:hypothetical protein